MFSLGGRAHIHTHLPKSLKRYDYYFFFFLHNFKGRGWRKCRNKGGWKKKGGKGIVFKVNTADLD